MGLRRACWTGRIGSGSQVWARPKRKGKGYCFLNLIFNAKTIPENIEIVLKARKILKIPKISGKFPEAHWGHEQSK
jgi:hypothetical protein